MKEERYPFLKEMTGCRLAAVSPEAWHLLRFPDYQRTPSPYRIREILKGLKDGYTPAPIVLYDLEGVLYIVDGGHRVMAYRQLRDRYGIDRDIPAMIYAEEAIDQNQLFVNENNKLRMDPTAIIRADQRHMASFCIRGLNKDVPMLADCDDVADFPIRPLTLVKAALILGANPAKIDANTLAFISVSRALDSLEAFIAGDETGWWYRVPVPFYNAVFTLWGREGKHLLNFSVQGFALFCMKNGSCFFDKNGDFVIKSARTHVSAKRGTREIKLKNDDRSDFAKLSALKPRWEKLGDQLSIAATYNTHAVAREINNHYWKNRSKAARVWQPEM